MAEVLAERERRGGEDPRARAAPCTMPLKRAEISNGVRLRVKPRDVISTARVPSIHPVPPIRSTDTASSATFSPMPASAAWSPAASSREPSSCSASASSSTGRFQSRGQLRPGETAGARRQAAPRSRARRLLGSFAAHTEMALDRRARQLCLHILEHVLDPPAADARAEELRREVRNLVRLIEDHRIRPAENVAEAVFLQRQIRQQQVVIDDDDVRFLRQAPRRDDVAARILLAALARGSCRASR